MKKSSVNHLRVLAIDPCTRGFGFALLEGPERLIDWGVKHVTQDKNASCLSKIDRLIEYYQPEVIVVEDPTDKGSRRRLRVRELIQEIELLALRKKINRRNLPYSRIQKAFSQSDVLTKYQIAAKIAEQYPELCRHLPRLRRTWMAEDWRMSIFVAVSLAIAFFNTHQSQRAKRQP